MLVELPEEPAFAGATLFVWASAVPPQDNAADEITAIYILRFQFFFFSFVANFFINLHGLRFSAKVGESFWDLPFAPGHEAARKYYFGKFQTMRAQRLKP